MFTPRKFFLARLTLASKAYSGQRLTSLKIFSKTNALAYSAEASVTLKNKVLYLGRNQDERERGFEGHDGHEVNGRRGFCIFRPH